MKETIQEHLERAVDSGVRAELTADECAAILYDLRILRAGNKEFAAEALELHDEVGELKWQIKSLNNQLGQSQRSAEFLAGQVRVRADAATQARADVGDALALLLRHANIDKVYAALEKEGF